MYSKIAVILCVIAINGVFSEVTSEETALATFGDVKSSSWLRFKRSCGSCCGGGSCCGMASPCAASCCSMPSITVPLPPPCGCSCGQPGCGCGCAAQACPCAGSPGCGCGPAPSCACGQPGCNCGQTSLVIPVQQSCCKCCQPICAPACMSGGGCSFGCRRKRNIFSPIHPYEAGLAVPASNL